MLIITRQENKIFKSTIANNKIAVTFNNTCLYIYIYCEKQLTLQGYNLPK